MVILLGGTPKPLSLPSTPVGPKDFDVILRQSTPSEFPNSTVNIMLSSYSGTLRPETANASEIFPSSDSFIRGAIQAWGEHLHLEIRPDEVWFTILTQLNFYMERNAEAVRHLFVKHQGQETIFIEDTTWTKVLWRFKDEIQARILTPWLKDWIVPDFSTTTDNDIMTANILMMGLMKAYFRYEGGIICGLPSVTLLGKKEDWEKLLSRLDRLSEFGKEPDEYRARLTPLLKRFVRSFDIPDSPEIRKFWNQIVFAKHEAICGGSPLDLSGWITGFIYWKNDGTRWGDNRKGGIIIDGISYGGYHDILTLPSGYARAPFIMRDFMGRDRYPAYVAAGTLGKRLIKGAPHGYIDALVRSGQNVSKADLEPDLHGTLRPLSAWLLYGPLEHTEMPITWRSDAELSSIASRAQRNLDDTCRVPVGSSL